MEAESPRSQTEQQLATAITTWAKRSLEDQSPLFLIVQYEHESDKISFIAALQQQLKNKGLGTRTLSPENRPEHGLGKLYPLLIRAAQEQCLALISGLPRAEKDFGPNLMFLDYINLQRDQILNHHLRFVLFIHESQAQSFIQSAGDLWDFRHHTFWLERQDAHSEALLFQHLQDKTAKLNLPESELQEIREHQQEVHQLFEASDSAEDKAGLLLDLTTWLSRRHAYKPAIEAGEEGLSLLEGQKTRLVGELEHELGYALDLTLNLPESLKHYQQSLEIRNEVGDRKGEGVTLNNISKIYKAWGRYDEALVMLQQSLEIRKEVGDRSGEGVTLNNISTLYQDWGRYDEALDALQQSLEIFKETLRSKNKF